MMEIKLVIDATPQLIEAVKDVAAALRGTPAPAVPAPVATEEKPKKTKAEPKPEAAKPVENLDTETYASKAAEKFNAADTEKPKHTLEECVALASAAIEAGKQDKLRAALAVVGAKTVSKMEANQYADFLKAMNEWEATRS
jgi:hypothetical protein